MTILKLQVSSSWLFVSLFIVMTHNSTVNLKLTHFLLWTKRSYQSSNFDTCKCSGENLRNSSCHFPRATSQLLFKFGITLQCYERLFLSTFLAQTIYTLLKRSSLKWEFLRLNECSGQILSNSICQFWNDQSIPPQILYLSSVSWKISPLYFFLSYSIYFTQKELIKITIFETFECSGQILSNSLCQFWNDKSIPLQIVYLSSVSLKISPLYFFSSNSIYFAEKELIKMTTFETFECSGQILSNSLCQFWNDKFIPL